MTKLRTILRRFGITRGELGVTAHGLRHQYANDRYAMLTGAPAPVRGGPAIDPAADDAARLAVAQELGHARKEIASAYLGPIPRKKRAPGANRRETRNRTGGLMLKAGRIKCRVLAPPLSSGVESPAHEPINDD